MASLVPDRVRLPGVETDDVDAETVTAAERELSRVHLRDTLTAVHTALARIAEWTTWLPGRPAL